MKNEDDKDVKKASSKAGKKKLDIATKAIIDNMVFSKTDSWAFYKISNSVYDFLSVEAKIQMAQDFINGFTALMGDRQSPLECQIIVSSVPVDVDAWESQVETISEPWDRSKGFDRYIAEQVEYLKNEEYTQKVAYLGVNLGKRGAIEMDATSFIEAGFKGAMETISNWFDSILKVPGTQIDISEEKDTRRREEGFFRTLSVGNLRAQRCTAEEILLLIKRQFYPSMPAPYLDVDYGNRIGPGDLNLELASGIRNKLRWLKINQLIGVNEYEGYRACLTLAKLPKRVYYPQTVPFMYALQKFGLPFTSYSRFTLHPVAKMKKELEKKKKEQMDELDNYGAGGATVDSALGVVPTNVTDALQDMNTMSEMLGEDKMPWVEGVYRIAVEASSEEELKRICDALKQGYEDADIQTQWTLGDQKDLFLEQMPGDTIRSKSHIQLTNLNMFGTAGFNYSSDVGDPISSGNALMVEDEA